MNSKKPVTKLPIRTTPGANQSTKQQQQFNVKSQQSAVKSTYLITPPKTTSNLTTTATKTHLKSNDERKINETNNFKGEKQTSSSSQIHDMIDRFRFSKPLPPEKREKQNFWWNNESIGI